MIWHYYDLSANNLEVTFSVEKTFGKQLKKTMSAIKSTDAIKLIKSTDNKLLAVI